MRTHLLSIVLIAALGVAACGETPTEPTPVAATPVQTTPVVESPAPAPVVTEEPFCPYDTFEKFEITEVRSGVFEFSFRVKKDERGRFLTRYQIQVYRSGREFTVLEVEAVASKLGGPHNTTVFYVWQFPGNDPGAIAGRLRVWYPDECHGDSNHGLRLNGPWSDLVTSQR